MKCLSIRTHNIPCEERFPGPNGERCLACQINDRDAELSSLRAELADLRARLARVVAAARDHRAAQGALIQADVARSKKFCADGKPHEVEAHAAWLRANADLVEAELAAAVREHEIGKALDAVLAEEVGSG